MTALGAHLPRWLRRAQRQPVKTRQHDRAWVMRMAHWGVRVLAIVMTLALVFTMVNVQQFAAQGHPELGVQWWIAWLLDPMASLTMVAAIVYEGLLSDYGKPRVVWLEITKWYTGIGTWGMNIWSSAATSSWHGVWLHSIAPGIALGLAQAAPRVRRHMAEILEELADTPAPQVHPGSPVADDLPEPTYRRVSPLEPSRWSPPEPVVPSWRPVLVPDPQPDPQPAPEPAQPSVVEPRPPDPVQQVVAPSVTRATSEPAPEPIVVTDPVPVPDPEPVPETQPEPTGPVTDLEGAIAAIWASAGNRKPGRAALIEMLPEPKPSDWQVRQALARVKAANTPVLNGAGANHGGGSTGGDSGDQ